MKKAYYELVKQGADNIHELVKENLNLFQADGSSEMWYKYLDYLDEIVVDGLSACINCSLTYILNNTEKDKSDMLPLLEAKLELQAPEMVFEPTLEQEDPNGFIALVEDLIEEILHCASLVGRVAAHKGVDNYLVDVEEIGELLDLREEILTRVSNGIEKATEHCNSFETFAYLWIDDREEFMKQFLLYGHVLTAEELEEAGDNGVPETPPALSQFKEQVDSYEKIYNDVINFKVSST